MQNLNENGPEVVEAEFVGRRGGWGVEQEEEKVGGGDGAADQPESLAGCFVGW